MTGDNDLLKKMGLGRSGLFGAAAPENEDEQSTACYGWLRARRDKAHMLDCRPKTGKQWALSYSWLCEVEFDPSRGLVLNFTDVVVRFGGRNLRPLYELAIQHRLLWVAEADPIRDLSPENDPCVTEMIITRVRGVG